MAALLRALCLLPLLFVAGFAQSFFTGGDVSFQDPTFGVINEITGQGGKKADFETNYNGGWELVSKNSGVSAMHMIIFPTNKAIIFDSTVFGPSQIQLPKGNCRPIPKTDKFDCWAHGVEFDLDTGNVRTLKVLTDSWCSSGGLSVDGTLVSTGGWKDGAKAVRYLSQCDTCNWKEYPISLSGMRWYATQAMLADGRFVVVGGRHMFSYEFVPQEGKSNRGDIKLPFLYETTDTVENNLYPFVHLSTDGNLFIFANNRSILLDPIANKVIREFPVLPGGSRNYPASGMSALLPIKLHSPNPKVILVEVIVCGGAKPEASALADKKIFLPALQSCGKLAISKQNPVWKMENMPTQRTMGDMLLLPTGDILLINGAKNGVSGWELSDQPNLAPVLYSPRKPRNQRFKELAPTTIPRMYHSTSAVLPDGKILVAGSNTHSKYNFSVAYPTELRVEKFSPPYLDPSLEEHKPEIVVALSENQMRYGQRFVVQIKLGELALDKFDVKMTMYAPPFTTHGFSMNQRLLVLGTIDVVAVFPGVYHVIALAPPSGAVAPPGYYLVHVVHRGVPSHGMWVQIM